MNLYSKVWIIVFTLSFIWCLSQFIRDCFYCLAESKIEKAAQEKVCEKVIQSAIKTITVGVSGISGATALTGPQEPKKKWTISILCKQICAIFLFWIVANSIFFPNRMIPDNILNLVNLLPGFSITS